MLKVQSKEFNVSGNFLQGLGLILIAVCLVSCGDKKDQGSKASTPAFPKNAPQALGYENVSRILQDMKHYSEAVKKLDQPTVQTVDQNYQGVVFQTRHKPLFLNVYPDPAGGRVIFLLMPKDPTTGSNYLLTFDKKLPVIDNDTVELQIRTKDPEKPLTCTLEVADAAAYMTEYPTHDIQVEHTVRKRFLQSGSYDFDALTVPGYRTRGYMYITFDLMNSEVKDLTSNLTAKCVE